MGTLAPFAREGLSVDDDVRGFLLLCLDMGPVAAMLLAGLLSAATAVNRSSRSMGSALHTHPALAGDCRGAHE